MKWPAITEAERIARLAPPRGRVDMVLDTDTYNEVDDQFALCYALRSPDSMRVAAVYAAPFHNARSNGPADGMEKSYAEILRLLDTMGVAAEGLVYRGSQRYLPDAETPVESPAARDLISRALERPEGDPLYVVAIGAITNVASALLMEPAIARNIVIVWLGGHPLEHVTAQEFNLSQDLHGARVIFDCGAPVVLVPCVGVASHLLTTVHELRAHIGGKNPMCDALIELFCAYHTDHYAWAKEIWDVSAIAWLVDDGWMPSSLRHSPLLTEDSHWAVDKRRHLIRVVHQLNRNPIFQDMFRKLGR